MNSIRITNMRSLVDTGTIDLKSINMLVGSNSSGKSTFLRVFPLLKQSFFRRINGPILWAGDEEDYVDFGSYKETINKHTENNCIGIEFTIPYKVENIENQIERYSILENTKNKHKIDSEAKLSIEISNKDNIDMISKIKIKCNTEELYIDKEKNKEYFNGKEIKREQLNNDLNKKYRENYRNFVDERNSILNILYDTFRSRELYNQILTQIFDANCEENNYPRNIYDIYKQNFLNRLIVEIFINEKFEIDKFIKQYKENLIKNNPNMENMISNFLKIKINENVLKDENNIKNLKILYISEVGKFCIDYIQSYFIHVNYVKPVRAHAERYYRLRNLSVDQIDSDGRNLPIFINSLSQKKLREYNEWIYEYFNFKITPMQTDGHVSINIEKDNKKINLSDTGYGYSQLLPIITQLWVILNMQINSIEGIPIVFAIEQPELHLHPELQAKLIDVISKVAKNKKNKIQFILETHSETMINRLGNLIYKNKISEKDVNIVIFEKEIGDYNTQVKISKFNEDGYLENWPIGFFSVDDIK